MKEQTEVADEPSLFLVAVTGGAGAAGLGGGERLREVEAAHLGPRLGGGKGDACLGHRIADQDTWQLRPITF